MTNHPGEFATTPSDIPAKGWWQVLRRAWDEVSKDSVGLVSAGVAFYGLLAIFPALTALLAISGLVTDPDDVTKQIGSLGAMLPEAAAEILIGQAQEVTDSQNTGLGVAALVALALAIYSASKGVGSLMEGLNIAYDEKETRGFFRLTATRLALTLVLVLGMVAAISAIIALPSLLTIVDLGATTEMLIGLARWAILLALTLGGIALLYRYAPDRDAAKWRWLTPGAVLACALWIAASMGFSVYVENFGSYNETFGALAGVIILLTWLWISTFVILFGAEVNAEAEAQTRRDSTIGDRAPMGQRDAVKADTVAKGAS